MSNTTHYSHITLSSSFSHHFYELCVFLFVLAVQERYSLREVLTAFGNESHVAILSCLESWRTGNGS